MKFVKVSLTSFFTILMLVFPGTSANTTGSNLEWSPSKTYSPGLRDSVTYGFLAAKVGQAPSAFNPAPLILFISSAAIVSSKEKTALPTYVLNARDVIVLIDPDAGISMTDPLANRKAQDQVEKAIMKWGRFRLVPDTTTADLVIVIRKGSGKAVQPTIGGVPTNDRPVIVQRTDSDTRSGGQKGHPPGVPQREPQDIGAHPQLEVGQSEDMFVVYQGHIDRPLEYSPVWRYIAKNALHSPDVPAVGEFRKLIEEAEKQRQSKP